MMLTLGQAAKKIGISKTAISRAVKSGRLSATRGDQGEYQIDPTELFRVYPVTSNGDMEAEQHATPKDNGGLQGKVEVLRELMKEIKEERDDLRRRLDNAEEARRKAEQAQEKAFAELSRLTLLLTDQREKPKPEAPPPATFRPWLVPLAAAAAVVAALAAVAAYIGTLHPLP